ncbi:MAG TPA: glutamate racemase [Candidatus Elarobacter sp.]|nr:glutamate racemase [Candidatus Elarobacter sp.]
MLGLYDSGLGGLTVLAALRRAGITQDVVYFADQAHNPYGDKTEAQLYRYLTENLALLGGRNVDAVVAACNTSCAVARAHGWPPTPFPVLDLIGTAAAAFAGTAYRRVAVIATVATVHAGAYAAAIAEHAPQVAVDEIAAPRLVPIVETGDVESAEARDAVAEIAQAIHDDVDAIVYGCTHYPLLDRWFAQALPAHVRRIDPAHAQAAATKQLIARLALPPGPATTTFYTNGDPVSFERAVRRWTGDTTTRVAALLVR